MFTNYNTRTTLEGDADSGRWWESPKSLHFLLNVDGNIKLLRKNTESIKIFSGGCVCVCVSVSVSSSHDVLEIFLKCTDPSADSGDSHTCLGTRHSLP